MMVFVISVESSKKLVTQSVIIWHSGILWIGRSYMPWGHPLFFVYLPQLMNTTSAYGNSLPVRQSGMCRILTGDTNGALIMDHSSIKSLVYFCSVWKYRMPNNLLTEFTYSVFWFLYWI